MTTSIRVLLAHETSDFVRAAIIPGRADLVTTCSPWSVFDIVRHVAATAERFVDMHRRALAGDLSAPFDRVELGSENLRAVAEFSGNAFSRVRSLVDTWLAEATDDEQLVGHQFGPQRVGLLNLFLLHDVVLHHLDIEQAAGGTYRPSEEVVMALVPMWAELGVELTGDDLWVAMVRAGGRTLRDPASTIFLTHRTLPGKRQEVFALWDRVLRPAIAENADHLSYMYTFDVEDCDVIRVVQCYRTAQAATDFLKSAEYQSYARQVEALLAGPPELHTAAPVWTRSS